MHCRLLQAEAARVLHPTEAQLDMLARRRFHHRPGQLLASCLVRRFRLSVLRGYKVIILRWLMVASMSIAVGTVFLQLSLDIEVIIWHGPCVQP